MNKELLNSLKDEERIENQPVWDVRCWLEGLKQGEYLKVMKDGQVYTNADELFTELVSHGEYERNIEDGNVLAIVYQNGDVIKLQGIKATDKNIDMLDELMEIASNVITIKTKLNDMEIKINEKELDKIKEVIEKCKGGFKFKKIIEKELTWNDAYDNDDIEYFQEKGVFLDYEIIEEKSFRDGGSTRDRYELWLIENGELLIYISEGQWSNWQNNSNVVERYKAKNQDIMNIFNMEDVVNGIKNNLLDRMEDLGTRTKTQENRINKFNEMFPSEEVI